MNLKNTVFLVCALVVFVSCKKNQTKEPEPILSPQENILKIAPTEQRFEEWIKIILEHKTDKYNAYSVKKVKFTQLENFKLAEVIIDIDGVNSNFFIATLFQFIQPPKLNKYVLRPVIDLQTPTRTLIFSSGKDGITEMSISPDTTYTMTTKEKNLFYLGTME